MEPERSSKRRILVQLLCIVLLTTSAITPIILNGKLPPPFGRQIQVFGPDTNGTSPEYRDWPIESMNAFLEICGSTTSVRNECSRYPIDDQRRMLFKDGEMWLELLMNIETWRNVCARFNELTESADSVDVTQ